MTRLKQNEGFVCFFILGECRGSLLKIPVQFIYETNVVLNYQTLDPGAGYLEGSNSIPVLRLR